jgi:asparagine synthase (glutamine-hydrolysing)
MCGIAGVLERASDRQPDQQAVRAMCDQIAYRGPDDEGYFTDGPVALGFKRLSIIDLKGGKQPLTTPDGRYTIIFNGEVYNYRELRRQLEGHYRFTTASDTEVLLYHYIHWGPAGLEQLNGMFAFAVWDREKQELFLARDRFGKKPLYYTDVKGTFVFASELKSLRRYLPKSPALNRNALTKFFLFEHIPSPATPYENIHKLPAGHWLKVSKDNLKLQQWWRLHPTPQSYTGDLSTPLQTFDHLLDAAVHDRMVADVPVGVFLSGGIDSSTITWYMRQHTNDLHSFSVNFHEKSFDQADFAQLAAQALQTQHHEITFTVPRFFEILPIIQERMDEPLADASLLPTYLVSREAKKYVTVVLDGDGADELLYGYGTFMAYHLAETLQHIPPSVTALLQAGAEYLPTRYTNFSFDFKVKSFLRGLAFPPAVRNQVWIGSFHDQELRELLAPEWQSEVDSLYAPLQELHRELHTLKPLERLSIEYLSYYLPDDILQKIDRATMYSSVEARTPFLDHRLVSFLLQLPEHHKYQQLKSKLILKRVMADRLPAAIINRKKSGFGIPLGAWLRGPLKNLMEETLSPARLNRLGIVRPEPVAQLMQEHMSRRADHRKKLWTLMVWQWWSERWL